MLLREREKEKRDKRRRLQFIVYCRLTDASVKLATAGKSRQTSRVVSLPRPSWGKAVREWKKAAASVQERSRHQPADEKGLGLLVTGTAESSAYLVPRGAKQCETERNMGASDTVLLEKSYYVLCYQKACGPAMTAHGSLDPISNKS
jgi:hypothetical protein